MAARVGRHCQNSTRTRWHLDYVKPHLNPLEVWVDTGPENQEHHWAQKLLECSHGVPGFGCSDCGCRMILCNPLTPRIA